MKRTLIVILAFVISGCAATGARAPKGPLEQIELLEIAAQASGTKVVELTCGKYVNKKCVEPGKVFDADQGLDIYLQIQVARDALRAVKSLGAGEIAQCLGQKRTQAACIGAVRLVLNSIEAKLLAQQEK